LTGSFLFNLPIDKSPPIVYKSASMINVQPRPLYGMMRMAMSWGATAPRMAHRGLRRRRFQSV
jgi:hypothetical protein